MRRVKKVASPSVPVGYSDSGLDAMLRRAIPPVWTQQNRGMAYSDSEDQPAGQNWAQSQRFAAHTFPRHFPPGVYKYRSIEEAERKREIWEEADFQALWARRGVKPEDVGRS